MRLITIDNKVVWPGWETVRLIGRGSFGAVYEIQRNVFDDVEKAALKVISIPQNDSDIDEMYTDGLDEESITSTFQSHLKSIVAEYSMMRKMNGCANIVNCDDVRYVQHDDGIGWDIFIKMELLTPLAKSLPTEISEEIVVKIATDMCAALELCKKYGIVHRDIKPQNIFVSPNGDYKLGDFGIAKTVEKTTGGTKIGTYKYMAPEVYNNQPYGAGADIYSLGLVLYWLLNERRMPFLPLPPAKMSVGMEETARQKRFSGAPIPAPQNGSEELKTIVLKACAFDPKERYQSAQEMLADLNAIGNPNAVSVDVPVLPNPDTEETADEKTVGPGFGRIIEDKSADDPIDPTVGPKFHDNPPKRDPEEQKPSLWEKSKKVILLIVAIIVVLLLLLIGSCENRDTNTEPDADTQPSTTEQISRYTISFDTNGGAEIESIEVNLGSQYGTLPTPTRDGYSFDGWFTEATEGDRVDSETVLENAEDQTIYAHWTAMEFTATFDANGGTVDVENLTVTYDNVVGDLPIPVRAGYSFLGWYTSATEGEKLDADTVWTGTADATLYAQWTTEGYNITFDANGGSVSTESVVVALNSAYGELPTPTRTGYSFSGWYTSAEEGTLVTAETVLTDPADQTLYAYWSAESYTITFDANEGSVDVASVDVVFDSAYGELPTPTRTGYAFKGWYTAKEEGTRITADTLLSNAEDQTLYAQWTTEGYTVTFDANGGSISTTSVVVEYNATYGELPTPTRTGYTFKGWYTKSDGGDKVTEDTNVEITSDQTLYAKWSAKSYTVTFDANGGSTSTSSITVKYNSKYGELPTPTRTGYTFKGWYTKSSGGDKVSSDTKAKITSDQTLYAQWSVKSFKVTFDANGGSTSTSSITVKYGSTYGDLPTPTRTGYTFKGWYTKSSGGDKVTSDTKVKITSNQTLYAKWSAKSYEVSFDANGGSTDTSSITVKYGSKYGTLPTPTRDYYTFVGWYTKSSGGNKVTSSTKMGDGNTTVYAHWELNPLSGWVLASDVPSDAKVVENKWTYTRTQTTESTQSSLSGWTQTGSYWDETGSGSTKYASFPSGFDTSHSIYTSFAKSSYGAYDDGSTKREVTNSWAGYVYWHWMYNTAANAYDRRPFYKEGYNSENGYGYYNFFAFTSTKDYEQVSHSGQSGWAWYMITDTHTSNAESGGSYYWYRFDYYTSTYTDYQKIYKYKKVTKGIESSTQVTAGGEISNVQHYVKYREK